MSGHSAAVNWSQTKRLLSSPSSGSLCPLLNRFSPPCEEREVHPIFVTEASLIKTWATVFPPPVHRSSGLAYTKCVSHCSWCIRHLSLTLLPSLDNSPFPFPQACNLLSLPLNLARKLSPSAVPICSVMSMHARPGQPGSYKMNQYGILALASFASLECLMCFWRSQKTGHYHSYTQTLDLAKEKKRFFKQWNARKSQVNTGPLRADVQQDIF